MKVTLIYLYSSLTVMTSFVKRLTSVKNGRIFFITIIVFSGLQFMSYQMNTGPVLENNVVRNGEKVIQTGNHFAERNPRCNETFKTTFEGNLNVVQNYPIGTAEMYLRRLDIFKNGSTKMREFPVFVTAFDESHYNESQGLFKSIHETFMINPKYKDELRIIVYDLGMTAMQVLTVKRHCKCEVRPFTFQHFPSHVETLQTYAFKPIIVQEVLMEFGFVWWMDTSIRFKTNNIDTVLANAKKYSFLFTVSLNYLAVGTLTKHTFKETFDFLQEGTCKFKRFHEIWATTLLFHLDYITRVVIQAWVKCALNEHCIAPEGSLKKRGCNFQHEFDGRCHRFDQSVIGIIARRLFNEHDYPLARTLPPYIYSIERRNIVSYF